MTPVIRRRLKQALLDRDMNLHQLANLTGYTHQGMRNIASGRPGAESRRAIRNIEAVLGPVWSNPLEFWAAHSTDNESKGTN